MGRKIWPPALASGDETTLGTGMVVSHRRKVSRVTNSTAASRSRILAADDNRHRPHTRRPRRRRRRREQRGVRRDPRARRPTSAPSCAPRTPRRSASCRASEKRPSLALHVGEVPTPELAPDEVLIATFASSVNYNTVWSAIFEPVPTFAFLKRAREDARLRQAPRPALRTSSAPTPAASCCAPAPRSAAGSPATACSCTRTTSRSRSRRATTTRSSTPTSACGASSATSAAWASCAWRAATS